MQALPQDRPLTPTAGLVVALGALQSRLLQFEGNKRATNKHTTQQLKMLKNERPTTQLNSKLPGTHRPQGDAHTPFISNALFHAWPPFVRANERRGMAWPPPPHPDAGDLYLKLLTPTRIAVTSLRCTVAATTITPTLLKTLKTGWAYVQS